MTSCSIDRNALIEIFRLIFLQAVPVEACLSLCAQLPPVVRAYPAELKALAAMLRLRLFEAISLMPPATLEKSYTQLLRLLVSAYVSRLSLSNVGITQHDL